jgi:16S rRNA (uracil1498-N3)-methyltransferase
MRLHRFYITQKVGGRNEIEISDSRIVHQVRNVFRLEAARRPSLDASGHVGQGDRVILFNGDGFDYECEIVEIDKKFLRLEIVAPSKSLTVEKKITLFMSLIKKENFELVCEKATELGVTTIVPVVTQRTLQKNLNTERIEKIIMEASEQCGRGDVPKFHDAKKLSEVLEEKNLVVCDMNGEKISATNIDEDIKILIGPEGGWSEEETKLFKEKNLRVISLGALVLRAETAAIAALAQFI